MTTNVNGDLSIDNCKEESKRENIYNIIHNLDELDLEGLLSIPLKDDFSLYKRKSKVFTMNNNNDRNKSICNYFIKVFIIIRCYLSRFYWSNTLLFKCCIFITYYIVGIAYYSSAENWGYIKRYAFIHIYDMV